MKFCTSTEAWSSASGHQWSANTAACAARLAMCPARASTAAASTASRNAHARCVILRRAMCAGTGKITPRISSSGANHALNIEKNQKSSQRSTHSPRDSGATLEFEVAMHAAACATAAQCAQVGRRYERSSNSGRALQQQRGNRQQQRTTTQPTASDETRAREAH